MRIRRFTTAESPTGVRVQVDDVPDSPAAGATDTIDLGRTCTLLLCITIAAGRKLS